MYIRSELASARIRAFMVRENIECDPLFMVAEIIKAISVLIMMALIDPGCAVGIIAAQSFCEPFTQDMLDSYKTSALTGGNAGRIKMNKCREIMAAYNVNKLLAPTMTIILDETSSQSEASARTVAHRIEMLRLSQVVDLRNASIFVEQFGEPVHPDFIGDRAIFAQFLEDNPLYRPPSDLISWCIRFTMNKEMLVQKSITIDVICAKLRETYEDLYFVHTTERADEPIIRVYMRSGAKARMVENVCVRTFDRTRHASAARGSIQLRVHEIYEMLLDTIVRGVPGVNTVRIEKVLRTRIDETDAIVNAPDTYCIRTVGTNLAQISQFDEVNIKWSQTDAVMEIAELLGVEAARARIIIEMRGLVDKCDIRHYMIYADEMTRTGRVTSIERSGLSSREMGNVALRAGQASTVQVFTEAAINARRDVVTGVSGPITYGQIPRLGTLYNNFAIDPAMIRKYKRSARDVIGEL
jgi:DNA-directed RNA polymerase beta' subunit